MTARATAAVLLVALGGVGAVAVAGSRADEQVRYGDPVTVFRTVTETRTLSYQGRGVRWWAAHAVRARRLANARGITLRRIRQHMQARWAPTVGYAIHLAAMVFGVSETKMRAVAWCESRFDPWATNGKYAGIFQLGWSPFGLSPFDPVASALSTAATVVHDGSWRQWSCG